MSDGSGIEAPLTPTVRSWPPTWAAYVTCLGALVYGAMKLYMAAEGRIGLPGFATSGAAMDHIVLRQLGLVAVDLVGAMIALATVQSWGRIIPRWLLLTAVWGVWVLVAAGAAGFLFRTLQLTDTLGPAPDDWTGFVVVGFLVVWAGLWGATAWYYTRQLRARRVERM